MKTLEMTPERVREKLGLLPWDEWADRASTLHDPRELRVTLSRRTGRTTRMLVEAVSEALAGRTVILVGHNRHYASDLVLEARCYINKIDPGILHHKMRPEAVCSPVFTRDIDYGTSRLFIDHHAFEMNFYEASRLQSEWDQRVAAITPIIRRTVYEMLLGDDPFDSLV